MHYHLAVVGPRTLGQIGYLSPTAFVALAGMAGIAQAQDAPAAAPPAAEAAAPERSLGLDDIIVTARRRAESLINVPVAVTALGAADLNRYGAPDLKKIGQLAPQVIIAEAGSGSGASFSIRGIGSPALDIGIEQTVAVNIDGLLVSRGRVIRQGFFDMQQIEVLKGPQALFFGKNSPAGVISITTANPTEKLEGYVRAGYEFVANERYAEAAIGGPITNTLKARIAIRAADMDGYIVNTAKPLANPYAPPFPLPGAADHRQPANRELLGRLTLLWNPTDSFDANLKVNLGRFRSNTDSNAVQAICANPTANPTASGISDPNGDCILDRRRSSSASPVGFTVGFPGSNGGEPYARQNTVAGSLTLNYKLENLTITSVTGYFDIDVQGYDDFTYTNVGRIWSVNGEKSRQLSQELRLVTDYDSSINFTLGGYFEDMDRRGPANGMVAFVGPDPTTGRFFSYTRAAHITGNTYSAFGQARWAILDGVELAGGVRYTREKRDLEELRNTYVHQLLLGTFALNNNITGKFADSNWSPEATLSWHPTPNQTLYAAYKTGYKSGGFSVPGTLTRANNLGNVTFGSERAKGGEVGYKAQLFDRRARIEAAVYKYNFSGLQQTSFDAPSNSFFIRNAAKASSKGAELSGDFRATPELQLRAAMGYNRSRFGSFPGAPCYAGQTVALGCAPATPGAGATQNLSGRTLVRAPRWVVTMGGNYEMPVNDRFTFGLSADANYSSAYATQENFNPLGVQGSFWRLNASTRLVDAATGLELALIGRNLTNKYYIVTTVDKPAGRPGEIAGALQRPREIMVQGTFRF